MNYDLPEVDHSISRDSVAELLINKDEDVIDFSLIYPYFDNRLEEGEYIMYGIHSMKQYSLGKNEICDIRFETADEAEDYLIDKIEVSRLGQR